MTPNKLTKSEQLKIIQGLCLLFSDSAEDLKTAKKIIEEIYKISHLNQTCENKHLDWHREGKKWLVKLKSLV